MNDRTATYEKLGAFYLGRIHDMEAGETTDDLLLYDSKDLTTHAVCVGMTGSGKTGLCMCLLEEAVIDGRDVQVVADPAFARRQVELKRLGHGRDLAQAIFDLAADLELPLPGPIRWRL